MRNRIPSNKISSPSTAMAENEKDSFLVEGRRINAAISLSRKKAKGTGGLRSWLVIEATGNGELLEVGKHVIMRRAGLPARDLRILDPVLSYPSTILGRERAIVINLEHIKAIITSDEVLLLNSKDPVVAPFADDLQRRLPVGCCMPPQRTITLEKEAYPALDELTTKISTLNLERVRQIKSRLVAISGRVQKVRDELEHLLDDDEDMAEMYLTEKRIQQQLDETSSLHSFDGTREVEPEKVESDTEDESDEALPSAMHLLARDDNRNCSNIQTASQCSNHSGSKNLDVEELEMLLEAYFVQIDGTLNKLSALREYVEDTEDYINIMLDDKQNQLLQMGVMLSIATLLLNCAVVVVGVFGMNIDIGLFDEGTGGTPQFLATVLGSIAACVVLYIIAIVWGKKKRLLE